jgi:aspartate kinase
VSAIAGKTGITVLRVTAARMLFARGFLRRVFEIFERHETSVDVVATSEVSVSVTIDDPARLDALLVDLRDLGDVSIERNRGIIAIVGAGISDAGGSMGKALMALGDVKIQMMSLSATGINLTVIVDEENVKPAMQRLHGEFFGSAPS